VLLQAIREHSNGAIDEGRRTETILLRTLADRIPAYLQKCRRNTNALLGALDQADFKAIEIVGHQMMGSGASYGFQPITDMGAGLEQAAASADADASRKWVDELSSYLNSVEISRLATLPVPLKSGVAAIAVAP
jgi:HPt (histidine-containing phosphotransfer) domain-containing protein